MDLKLTGKRVLVTGGNSGLGEAMVRQFFAEGASVAINYVANAQSAENLRKELSAGTDGRGVLALQADVSQAAEVASMFDQIDAAWNGVDILINNAGIDGGRALVWDAEPDEWNRVIQINLGGAFLCAREALRRMIPRKSGVIINISSVHEQIAWSYRSAYASSKAALSMLAKTLAQEAGPFGVRVLSIAPGAIRTAINADVWQDPEGKRDLIAKIPLGRLGEAPEIASLATVLASEVGSYITGTTVFVDGGMTDYPEFRHGG